MNIALKYFYKTHLKIRNLPITFPLPADASAKAIKRFWKLIWKSWKPENPYQKQAYSGNNVAQCASTLDSLYGTIIIPDF